ncbi:class I SAM-dependent methyltransferase [Prochlorococcus marinus]|uniref:class I SAM-dependent methyltransferase n=1 Tax=Prochlorococcus marinus TaxID=1219 RepID=UPI0039B1135C
MIFKYIDKKLLSILNRIDNKYNIKSSFDYYKSDNEGQDKQTFLYLIKKLKKYTKLVTDINIKGNHLDLGCGTGRYFIDSNKFKLYGLDPNKYMITHAKSKSIQLITDIQLVNGDLDRLMLLYLSIKFNLIYYFGVFGEHTVLDRDTLWQLISLLNQDGILLLTIYTGGIRRSKTIKKVFTYISKILIFFNLSKSALFITRTFNINLLSQLEDLKLSIVEKQKLITNSISWSGSHLFLAIRKL